MYNLRSTKVMVCLLSILLGVLVISAQMPKSVPYNQPSYVPNRILVKPKDVESFDIQSLAQSVQASEVHELEGLWVFRIDFKRKVDVPRLADELSKDPSIEFAEPDYIVHAVWTPNDTYFGSQWGLTNIRAPSGWDVWRGDSQFKVAIVDTGIDYTHPDLSSKYAGGYDFYNNDNDPRDDNGHGTHVSGIASAVTNNSRGIAGTCPEAKILAVKVLNQFGSGTVSVAANGIRWAADNGAHAINMSWGSYSYSSTLESAVNYAWNRGSVLVGAAGNDNTTAFLYPAAFTNVIAVAANTSSDTKAGFSNYGSWVELTAPGVNILSTWPNNQYAYSNGTSMAAPFVTGSAVLVYSKLTPNPTNRTVTLASQVRSLLENNADPVGNWVSKGRLNMNRAIRAVRLNGDVDGNGCIDDSDLLAILFAFGSSGPNRADLNSDGTVDDADLLVVLFNFGQGC